MGQKKMNKWPEPIYKTKIRFGNIVGLAWYDRWRENIWFEANGKLYVPLQVDKLIDALPFNEQLNICFKLTYAQPIRDLIPDSIALLKRLPKTDVNWPTYPLPIIYDK